MYYVEVVDGEITYNKSFYKKLENAKNAVRELGKDWLGIKDIELKYNWKGDSYNTPLHYDILIYIFPIKFEDD